MNKENLLWILLGIAVGYLAWEEFSQPNKCGCNKKRSKQTETSYGTISTASVTPNNRNFPPIKNCCGG